MVKSIMLLSWEVGEIMDGDYRNLELRSYLLLSSCWPWANYLIFLSICFLIRKGSYEAKEVIDVNLFSVVTRPSKFSVNFGN